MGPVILSSGKTEEPSQPGMPSQSSENGMPTPYSVDDEMEWNATAIFLPYVCTPKSTEYTFKSRPALLVQQFLEWLRFFLAAALYHTPSPTFCSSSLAYLQGNLKTMISTHDVESLQSHGRAHERANLGSEAGKRSCTGTSLTVGET